ncbi:MAG TPA: YceI family protein [Candidatus Krumholzibacteria bacterium]|nr:YceI family protein [Candidatus Krumholzibacteria bacterium]
MTRILLTSALALMIAVPALATEYRVKPGAPNKVVFVSKAATETFEGKTDRIEGHITFDPASAVDTVIVELDVDMKSLDTGIGKRNSHMKENHLETEKYPKATFKGASVIGPKGTVLAAGKTVTFECEGDFTLHGVTKRLRVNVDVTPRDENTLAFKTSFKVPLADYNISRPKFLFLKLGEVQEVNVEGVAIAN